MERNRASNYVTTPTAEAMFEGANDLRNIPAGVIKTNVDNLNVTRSFARTKPIAADDIGFTNINQSPFEVNGAYKYDIQDALINRTTTTFGDIQIFAGVPTQGYSAIEVIPRATTSTPGIVIVGDNLEVDSNGRLSAKNSYVHPSTHPASIIVQDATHRFVTDTEKRTWNGKANTSGTYTGLVVGSAAKWTTARTITLAGGVTGSVSLDGSANVSINTTVTNNSHTHLWANITDKPSTFTPSSHNQASNTITAMTGYAKASTVAAISATDSLNAALGKLEKALDSKQASGSYAAASHNHDTVYAKVSHGNHVPATQTASNKVFLRNDNTWQTITPANIGAAAASHTHAYLPTSGGTISGALTVTGQILSNADVVAYSDARFKTNIRVIENPIEILNSISGYRYNMLGVDHTEQVGVIAQELVKVLPEAVITDNNGMMGVRYSNLIPLLIEAVKELSERLKNIE